MCINFLSNATLHHQITCLVQKRNKYAQFAFLSNNRNKIYISLCRAITLLNYNFCKVSCFIAQLRLADVHQFINIKMFNVQAIPS